MLTEQEKIRIRDENTIEVRREEQRKFIENMTKCLMEDFGLSKEKAM